jgi:hypothetical protein
MDTSTLDNPLQSLIADDQAPSKDAAAVQHCLVYLSGELRKLGLGQAAKLVDDAVRQVSDVQRFCEAERRYHQELPSAAPRRRPHGSSEMHTAYMVPGE